VGPSRRRDAGGEFSPTTHKEIIMNSIRTKICSVLACASAAASLSLLPPSAQAADQDPPTKTVRFDDLNLKSSAGARALYRRIRLAAKQVCDLSIEGDALMQAAAQTCRDKAIDDAVLRIHAPILYTMRFGGDIRLASE
jgi:UrcA family protein